MASHAASGLEFPLNPATVHLWQLGLANEFWNGSKGRTHVRRLDWILNGQRCATTSAALESRDAR